MLPPLKHGALGELDIESRNQLTTTSTPNLSHSIGRPIIDKNRPVARYNAYAVSPCWQHCQNAGSSRKSFCVVRRP